MATRSGFRALTEASTSPNLLGASDPWVGERTQSICKISRFPKGRDLQCKACHVHRLLADRLKFSGKTLPAALSELHLL